MRPSSFIMPALFFFTILLTSILSRFLRPQAAQTEILPSTSLLPSLKEPTLSGPSVVIEPAFPGLGEFAGAVLNGHAGEVVGIYVEDVFALPVVQQPRNQPAFVSTQDQQLTQFAMPTQYGAVGLLAHNYLSGRMFSRLLPEDEVVVIYGDGRTDLYRITHAESYQALNPVSPYSDFLDLAYPESQPISSAVLFNRIYTRPDHLVFQTCIEANGDPSWGRLFVTAVKDTSIEIHLPAIGQTTNN